MSTNRVSKADATKSCLEALEILGASNIKITAYSKSLMFLGDLDDDTIIIGICSFFNGLITNSFMNVLPLMTIRISKKILNNATFDEIIQVLRTGNLPEHLNDLVIVLATVIGVIIAVEERHIIDCCILQAYSKNKESDDKSIIEHVAGTVIYRKPEDVLDTQPLKVLECYYNELLPEEFDGLRVLDKDLAGDIISVSNIKPRIIGVEPDESIDIAEAYKYLTAETAYSYEDILKILEAKGIIGYDINGNMVANGADNIEDFLKNLESIVEDILTKKELDDNKEDEEEC